MERERLSDRSNAFNGMFLLTLALACFAHAGEAVPRKDAHPAQAAPTADAAAGAKADSLHALRVLLSSEVKTGNEVLILKNPAVTDSLLRNPPTRESFLQGLRDSALARPVRTPEEFRGYWNRIEKENGIPALRSQMAAHDVDKTLIPKAYLFDSSVVVYPGWIIVRRKTHR